MARDELEIPNNMRKVYRRFQRWRSLRAGRPPTPELLWAAAEVAREKWIFPTAKALRLEYGKLKQTAGRQNPLADENVFRQVAPNGLSYVT